MASPTPFDWRIVLAFGIVYLVWGSTYLANIEAIETIPPSVLIVARLVTAGSFLAILSYFSMRRGRDAASAKTSWWPTRQHWVNMATTSFLFLTVGLGTVVWAEQYIESGTTAVMVAAEPLLVVLVLWAFSKERPRWQAFVGVALGIVGTVTLVGQEIVIEGEGAWKGVIAIMIGISAWAVGSVLTSRVSLPQNRLQTAGLQMLIAGALAVPFVFIDPKVPGWSIAQVSEVSAWSFAFLVVFGSIIAYSAFLYLLQRVSPEKVASSTYVHPVVALTLGVLWRDEAISGQTMVACLILLTGVLFVNGNWGERAPHSIAQPRQSMSGAIRRRWTGLALPGKNEELRQFLESVVIPDMQQSPGNLGARVVLAEAGLVDRRLSVESKWADEGALEAFVSGDTTRPKYYVGEDDLIEMDGQVVEHEALVG